MNAEQLKQSFLQENDINIFDIFAHLYLYCDPIFNTIRLKLAEEKVFRDVDQRARELKDSILPPKRNALAPIDRRSRTSLASSLCFNGSQSDFDLGCFALLRAIDDTYDNMGARSTSISNFPTTSQCLNLDISMASVYTKRPSPLYRLVQQMITDRSEKGIGCGPLRTGRDMGDYLRDYVYNLVCLSLPAGYDVDLSGLDSSVRLCFPDNLTECRIALVPLISQISQLRTEFFEPDSQNKIPFLILGLNETDRIVDQALAVLKQLSGQGVTMVIFPELSVPKDVRRAISSGLKQGLFPSIKMVVVGSCHEQSGNEWYNIAYVFGPDGQLLWQQRKLQPYTLMHYEAKCLASSTEFPDYNSYEKICTTPRSIVFRDTPMGRMAVLICSDLLHPNGHRKLLFDAGVDCIAVPTMSADLEPHFVVAAEQFAIHSQAMILVSNVCALAREVAPPKASTEVKISFAFLPAYPSIWWRCCPMPSGACPSNECYTNFILQLGGWPSDFE